MPPKKILERKISTKNFKTQIYIQNLEKIFFKNSRAENSQKIPGPKISRPKKKNSPD